MIEKSIIISFFVFGYCCTFWPGMIFEKLGDWLECNLPDWLWKPLGGCYICACMWIGSLAYWILWHNNILEWLTCCVCAMGLNAMFSQIIKRNEDI